LTGSINLNPGNNISITPSGNTLTIDVETSYSFFEGATAPTGFSAGDRWFDTSIGKLLTAITDNSNTIWVEFGGSDGVSGATGGVVGDYVISVNGLTGAVQYIVDFKRGWFLS
jgi:hypothetical protein